MRTKEEHREYISKWQKANRDKCNARARKYYNIHKESILLKNKLSGKNIGRYDAEKQRVYVKKHALKVKLEVFNHYSNNTLRCACCNGAIFDFLTIDHIGGRKQWNHKRSLGGSKLYVWLRKHNFPQGFEVVCMNCNWGRYLHNGICPCNAP